MKNSPQKLTMIAFIIPLKSRLTSNSWPLTCQLLERCLRSVCNQTDSNFRVIIVCHEKPDIQYSHHHIAFIQVDFPRPSLNIQEFREDKAKKTIVGLQSVTDLNPDYAMVVDADDCLSSRIAEFVNHHPHAHGWFLNQGYVYQEGSPLIYLRKSHFHRWCGTCNILKFSLWPLPNSQNDYPDTLLKYYSGSNHRNIEKTLRDDGFSLDPLPFPGAVYVIGNGENIYQKGFATVHNSNKGKPLFFLKELFKFRLLTSSLKQEFGLTQLSPVD